MRRTPHRTPHLPAIGIARSALPVDHPLGPANHAYADAAPGRRGRGDKLFACACAKGAWVGLYFVGVAAVLSLIVLLLVCDFSNDDGFCLFA
jgi:hypothetical protein